MLIQDRVEALFKCLKCNESMETLPAPFNKTLVRCPSCFAVWIMTYSKEFGGVKPKEASCTQE